MKSNIFEKGIDSRREESQVTSIDGLTKNVMQREINRSINSAINVRVIPKIQSIVGGFFWDEDIFGTRPSVGKTLATGRLIIFLIDYIKLCISMEKDLQTVYLDGIMPKITIFW